MSKTLAAVANGISPNSTKPNKKQLVIRTTTDAQVFSDTTTRVAKHPRAFADTVSLSDAAVRFLSFFRRAADSTSVSDLIVRRAVAARSFSDTESFSEMFKAVQLRALADTLSFSDTIARTIKLGVSAGDTQAFVDYSGRPGFPSGVVVDLLRLQTEATSYSETLASNFDGTRAVVDTAVVLDTVSSQRALILAIIDSLTLADNANTLKSLLLSVMDTMMVTELPIKTSGLLRQFLDSFNFSEAAVVSVVLNNPNSTTVQFADTVGTLHDPATVAVDLLRLNTEQQPYSENLLVGVKLRTTMTDTFSFSDVAVGFTANIPAGVIGAALVSFVTGGGTINLTSGVGSADLTTGSGKVN